MRYVNNKTVKSCQYCRTPLDKDYDICPYCKNELKSQTAIRQNESHRPSHDEDGDFVYGYSEQNSKGKKIGLICGICGGILAIALIVCIAITNSNISGIRNMETKPVSQTVQTTPSAQPAAAKPAASTTAKPVVVSMEKPKKVKITKVISGKKQLKIKWKKVPGVTKYRVKVSTNKKGNRDVSYETVASGKNSVTIKGLKKKTNYYVKVKAITVNYGVKVEGDYSKYIIKKTK